ncbi:MAG: large-conductance mechanosensitive channel protein MscL [Candidatus Falkowbacteria bacterium]
MKKIIQEFKEFAVKGNAIELATAVIIGGAFGKIVTSLVTDIIMPLAGLLTKGESFTSWKVILRESAGNLPPLTLNIGTFIQNIVDFLIITGAIFLMIKLLARLKDQLQRHKDEEAKIAPEPELTKDQKLLSEIRDLLKK